MWYFAGENWRGGEEVVVLVMAEMSMETVTIMV